MSDLTAFRISFLFLILSSASHSLGVPFGIQEFLSSLTVYQWKFYLQKIKISFQIKFEMKKKMFSKEVFSVLYKTNA